MASKSGSIYLTKQGDSFKHGDACKATEIEIAPAMIEAGAAELAGFDWMECDTEDAARRVYIAMALEESEGLRIAATMDCEATDVEDATPLMEMGEAIRKHGLPEIDRSPSSYWKNRAE